MNLWSHRFSQDTNEKLSGFLPSINWPLINIKKRAKDGPNFCGLFKISELQVIFDNINALFIFIKPKLDNWLSLILSFLCYKLLLKQFHLQSIIKVWFNWRKDALSISLKITSKKLKKYLVKTLIHKNLQK